MSSQVSYEMVKGGVMVLSAETTSMLDESVDASDRCEVEREIKRDAQVIADSTGADVRVETSWGTSRNDLGASPCR